MTQISKILQLMLKRATGSVPEGQPIFPDGPFATTQDMQEFKVLVATMGYEVKFGQDRAVVKPGKKLVALPPRCSVGTLTDEFLHVWNNHLFQRGRYLEDEASAAEHRNLAIVFRYSGSANDRRLHQLELANYINFLTQSGSPIPGFVWRTFTNLMEEN